MACPSLRREGPLEEGNCSRQPTEHKGACTEQATGDFVPLFNMVARRGAKAKVADWPSLVEKLDAPTGFQSTWNCERGLVHKRSTKAHSLASLASWLLVGLLLYPAQSGTLMGPSDAGPTRGLGPTSLEARSLEAQTHAGMHALLGSSLWDAATQCSTAQGSWAASTLLP